MIYEFPPCLPYRQIHLPLDIADKLDAISEDELKLYLLAHAYAQQTGCGQLEEDAFLTYLTNKGWEKQRAQNGLAYLRGVGFLVQKTKGAKKAKPVDTPKTYYTTDQLSSAMETSEAFRTIREFTEARCGKLLNVSELAILYSFIDSLRLPPDVIMLGIEYCAQDNKASLRYIEKVMCDLADKQIVDYENAETYLTKMRRYKSFESKVRTLCGFGARALTKKEEAVITRWQEECNADFDYVKLAYDKTIATIHNPSLSYMDTIIKRWQENGWTTCEQVEAQDGASAPKSFDVDDFFQAAVSKSRGDSNK